jgi:membrane protease YdiL (CAAX protease family)
MLWLSCVFEGGLLILALGLGWPLDVDPLASLHGASPRGGLLGLLAVLPLLPAFALAMASRWEPLSRIRRLLMTEFMPLLRDSGPLDLLLISALAGLGEEALFRGLLQTAIVGWTTPAVGLVAASVLFGLAHAVTRAYVVIATAMGLYLGLLFEFGGGLLPAAVAHGAYDFVALVYLRRRLPR